MPQVTSNPTGYSTDIPTLYMKYTDKLCGRRWYVVKGFDCWPSTKRWKEYVKKQCLPGPLVIKMKKCLSRYFHTFVKQKVMLWLKCIKCLYNLNMYCCAFWSTMSESSLHYWVGIWERTGQMTAAGLHRNRSKLRTRQFEELVALSEGAKSPTKWNSWYGQGSTHSALWLCQISAQHCNIISSSDLNQCPTNKYVPGTCSLWSNKCVCFPPMWIRLHTSRRWRGPPFREPRYKWT